jgi:hypothetical protein
MADIAHSRTKRGFLVTGGVALWALGVMCMLDGKASELTSGPGARDFMVGDSSSIAMGTVGGPRVEGDDLVAEITVDVGRRRYKPVDAVDAVDAVHASALPTYSLWFESQREIGVCKITYAGTSKTANLHVTARVPAGKLDFAYQCGQHSGRASIDVSPKQTNGVLFCRAAGGVKVETVHSKEDRCARR